MQCPALASLRGVENIEILCIGLPREAIPDPGKHVPGFQLRNSKCQVSLVECSRDYDVF